METLKFKSEKIVGRQNELVQLQSALEELAQGKGRTILVSGEAGIGKTRLINETIKHMEPQNVRTVKVYCLPHESTDSYLPFTEILAQIAPGQPLIPAREEKYVSMDEVFLVYKNGVLIAHTSKKEHGLDSDVVAGMFTAVQDFVKDTFGKGEAPSVGLRKLEYGEKNILIEHGRNIYIAAVLVGPTATKSVYSDLRGAVELIEKDYPVLESWDGDLGKTKGTENVLKMLTGKDYVVEKITDKGMLDAERLRVFEHVLNIVTNAAKEKPLLLFFDDLHWADPSSLQLLHYLSRNTKDYSVLLCGAYRPEELVPTPQGKPHPLMETLQLMSREQLITEVSLHRLKHDDTVEIVKSIFAHSFNPKFTERLHKETDGNPFFTEELLRAMVLDGVIYRKNAVWEAKDLAKVTIPRTVKDTVMRRINALDPECQEVLKYAAVIGLIFQFPTLAKTTGKDKEKLAELLEKIEKQGIIYSEEDILRFNHAKLQEVTYSDIPKYRRSILHEKTAQAIEDLNKEDLSTVAVELAHHFQLAGIPEKTAEYALLVAENAEKKYTPTEAAQHYMVALQALEKMKPTVENKEKQLKIADKIAYTYYITGDWDMSMAYAAFVRKLAKETKNKSIIAESYRNMGMIHTHKAEYDKAVENLQNALKISEEINDAHGIAEAQYWMGTVYWRTGRLDDATKQLIQCLSFCEMINDKGLMGKAYMDCGIVYDLRGDYDKSLELKMKSLNISKAVGDKYEIARAYNNIGVTYDQKGDIDKAIEWWEKAIKINDEIGVIRGLGYGASNIAEGYARKRDFGKAEQYTHRAKEIFEKLGERKMMAAIHRNYGIIYGSKKEWEKSQSHFREGIRIAQEVEDFESLPQIYFEYGKMYKVKGDKEEAEEQFKKTIEVYETLGNKAKAEEVKKELEKL